MRYRFCSSCTEEMDRQLREDPDCGKPLREDQLDDERTGEGKSQTAEMQGYNCIMIYSQERDRLLFCKRLKDPYEGKYNLVGGKIEPGEDHFDAAYRELFEETGISRSDVTLSHMMDFTYYNQNCVVEVYAGVLTGEVELVSEKHPLCWIDAGEDFFDLERFAGEGNIGHMVEQVREYGMGNAEKQL